MKKRNVHSFSSFLLFSICYLIRINVHEASHTVYPQIQSERTKTVAGIHRTAYHFQPLRNWINDPNGPMYYNGIYHLFYQYNPKGAVWGNIVWAHSISTDMINWVALEPALRASEPFDIEGCWSGSATILPGKGPVILYTGVDEHKRQLQNYALPKNLSDPYLREWIKPDNNPIIIPDRDTNTTQFRDPTTAWLGEDKQWRILVGAQRNNDPREGTAYLYKTKNFINWVKAHPIHSAPTGMWECPDFYPVCSTTGLDASATGEKIKHVMKASLDRTRYDYYTIGRYLTREDVYTPDNWAIDGWGGLRYDYGNFYASKTFYDSGKKRRILWGWANESDSVSDDVSKGWAGIQLIPRTVWLDENGKQLRLWPVEEIESLREKEVRPANRWLLTGDVAEIRRITAAQADVEVDFSFRSLDKAEKLDIKWANPEDLCGSNGGVGPFGLLTLASHHLEEYTAVFFKIFEGDKKHMILMCSDARKSTLRKAVYKPAFAAFVDADLGRKRLSLRSLIDNSVVESFGEKGKTCITSRIYPRLAVGKATRLFLFNNGSEPIRVHRVRAWNMKRPRMMNQNALL